MRKLLAYLIVNNQLRTTRISAIKIESPTVKTFRFKDEACAKAEPGQFLMLWIPGVDEIPLSILDADAKGNVSVAVKKVGGATEALHSKKRGEVIGVRGPFGNCFSIKAGRILMVGGGTGIAPLLFLARRITSEASSLTFVIGAKRKSELLFLEELERFCNRGSVVATTEDGSYGLKCLATAPLETLLTKKKFDMIYTCGPELMIRNVFDQAEKHKVPMEASLERLMRCAIGLCGSCIIGKFRVCRDGPVFNSRQLREVKSELGISKLGFDGNRIPIE
ncbi:MAG TPA: dihydroorotate dehydrogenase electron transfer subunit [Acidobacteriota bacterium]|nr:dihydroorotate dehydrogenase electron transfer subunit [Acidobacteriota bacterium]